MSDSIWGSQYHQQDRVYEMGDLCLAIPAQIPGGSYKYMEVKKLGNIYGFDGGNYAGNVYDEEALAPCMSTFGGGNQQPMVIEKQIVAQRGRVGGGQMLEPREDITNTLTSVPKDNLVLETAALRMVRTDEGKALRKDYESHKIHHGFNEYREAEPRPDGLSNTITTVQKDNMIVDIKQATNEGYIPCQVPGVANLSYPDSNTRRGRVVRGGQICPTLTTESIPNVLEEWMWEVDGEVYLIRIRKLTPKECWRLMDFNEGAFEKAQEVNSNTQLYKQAGNSIVVNCLVAIMGQLFEGKEDFYAESIRHRQAESQREVEEAQDSLPGT